MEMERKKETKTWRTTGERTDALSPPFAGFDARSARETHCRRAWRAPLELGVERVKEKEEQRERGEREGERGTKSDH